MNSDTSTTLHAKETSVEILVNVLLRRFSAERAENGDEETCSSPERMAPQQHH